MWALEVIIENNSWIGSDLHRYNKVEYGDKVASINPSIDVRPTYPVQKVKEFNRRRALLESALKKKQICGAQFVDRIARLKHEYRRYL